MLEIPTTIVGERRVAMMLESKTSESDQN